MLLKKIIIWYYYIGISIINKDLLEANKVLRLLYIIFSVMYEKKKNEIF